MNTAIRGIFLSAAMYMAALPTFGFSICAVGDSITQGDASKFTAHRIALEDLFDANTWEVVWKGTRSNSSYGTLNPCEGYSGSNAEQIASKYEENAATVAADVILLHAGHNYNADPGTSSPVYMPEADIVAAVTNAHARIIAAAREQNPNVIVLYAQVIESGKLPKYSYIPALNTAIAALAAELNTDRSPVVAVNMADGWDWTVDCVSDKVHPSSAGAEKMAAKWFAALQELAAAGKLKVVSRAESATALNVTTDTALSSDLICDAVTVAGNASLNLNGHKLTTKGIAGNGAVMSARIDESPCALGYDLLSYVETPADNTVKCYIDTEFVPSATDRIETKVRLGSSVSKTQWLFGTYNSNKRMDAYLHLSKVYFMLGLKNNGSTEADENGAYEIILDGNRFKATVVKGGEPTALAIESNSFAPDQRIYLFAANGTGDLDQTRYADECRMYYFRVFDADGNLKVNMLPVRNSSGTVGFYDTVRKSFHLPANGVLTGGDVISCKVLSYVATPADNSGTFIDTLYWPSPSDRVETRVRLSNMTGNQGLFSSRYNYKNNVFECIMRSTGKIAFEHYAHGGGDQYAHSTVDGAQTEYSTGSDYDLTMDGGTTVFSVNGIASETYLFGDLTVAKTNFVLFATVDAHTGAIANFAKRCRMYYFRVTDTNGYERLNLVPAKRISDNVVGFYDATHNAFLIPESGALEGGIGIVPPRDLTTPGGACTMSPSPVYSGTVANLFNNNFFYRQDGNTRVLLDKSRTSLPLRVDYDFGEGSAKAVNMYRIYAAWNARAPKSWILYGSNEPLAYGAATGDDKAEGWVALDVCESQDDWTHGSGKNYLSEFRTKIFANDTAYRFYRLKITSMKDESQNYLELVQLEYFRVEDTEASGVLNVNVSDGIVLKNSSVGFAGDLTLIKSGEGIFTVAKAKQGYLGGTSVEAGTLIADAELALGYGGVDVASGAKLQMSSPLTLTGLLNLASGAELDFLFRNRDAAPTLTLSGGATLPATLAVGILRDGDFALPGDGIALTSGGNFKDTAIVCDSDGVRRVASDASGNLCAYGPIGFMLILK